jgi:hypothetical protein
VAVILWLWFTCWGRQVTSGAHRDLRPIKDATCMGVDWESRGRGPWRQEERGTLTG